MGVTQQTVTRCLERAAELGVIEALDDRPRAARSPPTWHARRRSPITALAAFPNRPLAHYAKAQVLRAQHRFEAAIAEYETVVAFNRNWMHAIAALGYCKFMTGSIEEMIPAQEKAIRLSPGDPKIWLYYFWIGQVHLLQSRLDEAILW